MTIHIFNGFTDDARWPSKLRTGLVCALVETDQGLVLVDTGPGLEDYAHPHWMMQVFRVVTKTAFDPGEAAINQVKKLGYKPSDVRHIILTHMHFDHCGGLPDFPNAQVHIHRMEYESFNGKMKRWTDLAYIPRHSAGVRGWHLYDTGQENWNGFRAIRLPFDPEIWLVPLFGHSRGICGVVVKMEDGWFFNASDTGAVYNDETPAWLIKLVLGPHDPVLRRFKAEHPEVVLCNSHMFPEWFEKDILK